jgi:hypothetical protein
MKTIFFLSFIALNSLIAGNAFGHFTGKGHVHTLSETSQVFVNPDCQATDTCDLKRFTLTTSVYEIWFSDEPNYPTYANGVMMEYETQSVDALEKFAIVQFKKGCVFYSTQNSNGKITRNVGDIVTSFGEDMPFCFPQWVIDSQDADPVYNSDPEYGRFYFLRWNKPASNGDRIRKFYGAEKPATPIVYMTDHPSGAFVAESGVRNVALEFNTCIYKAGEVPSQARRERTDFAAPIACFEWQNIYVYDFAKGEFQTQLAGVPWWEEPTRPVYVYLLVLFAILLLALALAALSRPGMFLRRKIAANRPAPEPASKL